MDVRSLSTSLPAEQAERGTLPCQLSITQDHQRAALPQRSGTAAGPAIAALKNPQTRPALPRTLCICSSIHMLISNMFIKRFLHSQNSQGKEYFFKKYPNIS